MKKTSCLLAILLAFVLSSAAQDLKPVPADKAVVYFTRLSGVGFAINFTYFDSTKVIGQFNGKGYFMHVCEPGKHIFWARSENKDFVEADLEAGKSYFIESVVKMGWVKAALELAPVAPKDKKLMKKVKELVTKSKGQELSDDVLTRLDGQFKDVIVRGMEEYHKDKQAGKKIKQLEKEMYFQE